VTRCRHHLRSAVIACLALCGLRAAEHHGQVKFGEFPVPGATITATQGDKRFVAITNDQGLYSFSDLAGGTWKIQVEMLCFAPIEREIVMAPDAPGALWELKMQPMDTIRAIASPPAKLMMAAGPTPAPPPVQAQASQPQPPPAKPKKGKAAPPAPAAGAPAGFQRADLAASRDGAKLEGEAVAGDPAELTRNASDAFSINGSVNNGAASPFAQSAAFGNSRRGARSLYNLGLGVIFENSVLDARSFSLTGQDTPKPAYNHITGMFSAGGPVRIPHVAFQTPMNFFVAYQWMRNRNASTQSSLMPTAAERTGDLSQALNPLGLPVKALDPASGAPFPGNVIPQSRISPQASSLLRFYPLPNFDGSARYNYQTPLVGITDQDGLQTRLSKGLGSKNQVFGSFAWQRTDTETPNVFAFRDATNLSGLDTSVGWWHRVTQRLFVTLKGGYSRQAVRVTPFFANKENVSGEAGITGNNQDPVNWGPPALGFAGGIAALSDGQSSFTRNQTVSISPDVFWNRRGHNVKFGADFKRQQFNSLAQQDPRGSFTFTGATAGSDFAGFLLGIPDTSSIAFGNADKYFRAGMYDAYFTDDWRVSPALTINAGMRWEYGSPVTELYGRLVNLDLTPGFTAQAPVIAASPVGPVTGRRYPDSLVAPDRHGFQPRIGLAWRPMLASSMVIRAGYGVNYNTSVYQAIASQMAQQSPLSKSLSVQNSAANPLTLANGFNASPGITPNTFAIDPNFQVGYVQTWQASVQRDLPGALVVTATYLGIKGTRARQTFLPNTYPAGVVNRCPECLSGYAYTSSNGNSTRESGQLQLRRRLRAGFTAGLQYTYSKSIDDAALGGKGLGGTVIAQDWLNLAAERGLSSFDQRHLLNLQLQYSTGASAGGGALLTGWKGTLFKEWTVTTQITAGSGLPLTPVYVAAVRGTGVTGSIRPEYTGADVYAASPGLFLNPAAYVAPPAGQWGNAGRDSIAGPGQFGLDASLGRTFPFRDRGNIDLQFQSTNALNHVTFPSWNTTVTSGLFGLPNPANAMRAVKVSLRVRF
jgi:hypothetical protein